LAGADAIGPPPMAQIGRPTLVPLLQAIIGEMATDLRKVGPNQRINWVIAEAKKRHPERFHGKGPARKTVRLALRAEGFADGVKRAGKKAG
jgi:hypothetical protein